MRYLLSRRLARCGLLATALFCLLSACADGTDTLQATGSETPSSPAAQLLAQFGEAQHYFSQEGLQGLLSLDDMTSSITLLQLHSITDEHLFTDYEEAIGIVWEKVGGEPRFSSRAFGQILGTRDLSEFRAVTFPSAMMFVEAIRSDEFSDAMAALAQATDDVAWVLGPPERLPPPPTEGYSDPALRNLTQADAESLLAGANPDSTLEGNPTAILDMLLSDDPSPFYMVNLIEYYEQANYADGRDSDLTGREANAVYGQSILPLLLAYNSFPELSISIAANLTHEPAQWETAVIVRYASRDAFLNIFPLNPRSGENLIHKEAGVANTLVYPSSVASETLPTAENGPFYNYRYCEVLLATFQGEEVHADVYNSIPYSDCPQAQWDVLDAQAIAQDYGADIAILNGIRFWVLDSIVSNTPPSEPVLADFGGITMRLAASVAIPLPAGIDESSYVVAEVARDTVFTYSSGRLVYELTDPDGERYMMQSFSRVVDDQQQLVDLQFLARRLNLPPGWQFSTRVLQEDFQLRTVEGIARVVSDDLNNVYQRVPQ